MSETVIDTTKYLPFVPEYLRDNDGFMLFLQLMISEFNISEENIESFTDLVNPDKVPIKFIEYLGMYVNYHHIDLADDDFNRELLLSYRTITEQRGTDHSIIMAATHGDNEGYLGGDIFIPGYEISKDLVELTVATEYIFTHSKSPHSSIYKYADGDIYRPGVIIIALENINQLIRDKIDEVIPAGIKYKFFIQVLLMPPDEFAGNYRELSLNRFNRIVALPERGDDENSYNNPINLFYEMNPDIETFTDEILIFSDNRYGKKRSGSMIVSDEIDRNQEMAVSALSLKDLSEEFEVTHVGDKDFNYIKSDSGEYIDIDLKSVDTILRNDKEFDISLDIQTNKTFVWGSKNSVLSSDAKMSGIDQYCQDMYVDSSVISPYYDFQSVDILENLIPDLECHDQIFLSVPESDGEEDYSRATWEVLFDDDFTTEGFDIVEYNGECDGYGEFASSTIS